MSMKREKILKYDFYNIKNQRLEEIIKRLSMKNDLRLLKKNNYKEVYAISNKYIIKKSNINEIKAEKFFLDIYNEKIYEKILWYEENSEFIVYNYIENTSLKMKKANFKKILFEIWNIINLYKKINIDGFGEIFNRVDSWSEFLNREVELKRKDIPFEKEKYLKVKKAINVIKLFKFEKKLIHGDLGIYNILFKDERIVGVIDPRVIIGDALYDFIFFYLSHINIIKNIEIEDIINMLKNQEKEKIINLMYLLLYDRIAIETKNHREYVLEEYYKLWEKLEIIEKR